jgi:hypothetical protein
MICSPYKQLLRNCQNRDAPELPSTATAAAVEPSAAVEATATVEPSAEARPPAEGVRPGDTAMIETAERTRMCTRLAV